MDIYIKPEKKIITSKTGKVKIKDIAVAEPANKIIIIPMIFVHFQ